MTLLQGVIGFSSKKANWLSRTIRWFTRSKWSHCFLVYQTGQEVLVAEAGTFTVQLIPITKYQSHTYATEFFAPTGLSAENLEKGIARIRGLIERTYGWVQLAGFVPMIALRKMGFKVSNPACGGIICSELVLLFLEVADPEGGWDKMDRNAVTPEDIHAKLLENPRFGRAAG